MNYEPNPIDLSEIDLGKIKTDVEIISRNIHETWAQQRKNQGWKYGSVYDGIKKLHPCMIPYDDLPESERDIDRATVEQTIKMLIRMGYNIEKGK